MTQGNSQDEVKISGVEQSSWKKSDAKADDTGTRLVKLRNKYGYSQRELARRAGVTNGTICMIEQNLTSPQIGTLRKILSVFPISIAEFFSMELEPNHETFFSSADLVEMGGSNVSLRVVAAGNRNRKLQVAYERFAVSADTGDEMLVHEGEESGIVIRGKLEVTVGHRKKILGPGEAYYFSSLIPHRFRNIGRSVCEVVSAATPPSF